MAAVVRVDPGDPFLDGEVIGSLSDYTVDEEATPIVPGDSSGATPALTAVGVRRSRWALASGKPIELQTDNGSAHGVVTGISGAAASGIVTLTGDSLLNRLNVDVRARPYYGRTGDLASDNFTRNASSTSLSSTPSGQVWNALSGVWGISNNQAFVAQASYPSIAGVLVTSRNQSVSSKITAATVPNANVGVIVRMSDTKNYYFADFDYTGAYRVGKAVNGVYTSLATGTGFVSNDVMRLQINGNVLMLYRNSNLLKTIVDNSLSTGSWVGITANAPVVNSTTRWDDFVVTDPGVSLAGTLYNAFTAYTRLVGVPDSQVEIDPEIQYLPVVFPGFTGNLWDRIKQMCVAYGLQCYSTGRKIGLTKVGKVAIEIVEPATTEISIDQGDIAQQVQVTYHNHKATSEAVFFKADSVYSLEAGETQEVNVPVNGSPDTVNNPVCVSGMDLKATKGFGQYVVTGSDGYIMSPQLWRDLGGSVTARPSDESANEIILTLKAPEDTTRSPYQLSEGEDRPALWVTGAGVLSDPQVALLYTGNTDAPTMVIDPPENLFISTLAQAYDIGGKLAGSYAGPTITLTIGGVPKVYLTALAYSYLIPPFAAQYSVAATELTQLFGMTAGSILEYGDSKYRVLTASFKETSVDLTLTRHATFTDFNKKWVGKTFGDFNTAIGTTIEFGQLDIFPLTKGA